MYSNIQLCKLTTTYSNGVLLNKPGAAVCSNMEGSTTAEEKGMDMQFNTSIRLLIPTGTNE